MAVHCLLDDRSGDVSERCGQHRPSRLRLFRLFRPFDNNNWVTAGPRRLAIGQPHYSIASAPPFAPPGPTPARNIQTKRPLATRANSNVCVLLSCRVFVFVDLWSVGVHKLSSDVQISMFFRMTFHCFGKTSKGQWPLRKLCSRRNRLACST